MIRGNLLAIPIERSFLYVEPVYLQARQESEEDRYPPAEGEAPPEQRRRAPPRSTRQSTAIPELKKVIASFGGQVVMRNTLQDALMALFGRRPDMAALPAETMAPGKASAPPPLSPVAVDLAEAAEVHYRNVRESMQQWNWERAGKEMKALESTIAELKKVLRKE